MKKEIQIIAHRGYHIGCKENTIHAFRNISFLDERSFECDIRVTKDCKTIIYHDDNINGKKIRKHTYKELKKENPELLPLKHLLEYAKSYDDYFINFEIKDFGHEKETIELIKKYLDYDRYFISSFDKRVLNAIKKIDDKIKIGLLLIGKCSLIELFKSYVSLILNPQKYELYDYLVLHYHIINLPGILYRYSNKVITWTVNDLVLFKKIINHKYHPLGVITDKPGIFQTLL